MRSQSAEQPGGGEDGDVTSAEYLRASAAAGQPGAARGGGSMDWHHPLEDYLRLHPVRLLLKWLAQERPDSSYPAGWASTILERVVHSYRNPSVSRWRRLR